MSVEEWDPLPPGTGLFPKFECPDCAAAWWTAERLAEHRDRWHPPGSLRAGGHSSLMDALCAWLVEVGVLRQVGTYYLHPSGEVVEWRGSYEPGWPPVPVFVVAR